jgi:hypothetical protein
MCSEIAIAKAEPIRANPECREFGSGIETLIIATPAIHLIYYAAKGVHNRVQIRTDSKSKEGCVITGIGHDGNSRIRRNCT